MAIEVRRRVRMPAKEERNKGAIIAQRRRVIPIKPGEVMVERRKAPRAKDNAYAPEEPPKTSVHEETIARYKAKVKNPKTAIRAHCVECSGGSLKEVDECPVVRCALYPFRMGENPFNKKTAERLARAASAEEDGDGDE